MPADGSGHNFVKTDHFTQILTEGALVLPPSVATLRQKMIETFDTYTVANLAADAPAADVAPELEEAAIRTAADHTQAVRALIAFEPGTLSELVAKAEALRSREADHYPEEPGEFGLDRLCEDIVRVLTPWTPQAAQADLDDVADEPETPLPTHAPLTPAQVSASSGFAELYDRWYAAMCADEDEGDTIRPAPDGYSSWDEAMHVTPCQTVGDAFIKMQAVLHPELGLIDCGDGQWHGDALEDVKDLLERLATGTGLIDVLSQEAALLAHSLAYRTMSLENDQQADECEREIRLAWDAGQQILAAPCDSLPAARAKLRVALDRIVREGGSDWSDNGDVVALEQAIAFLKQVA